MTDKKQEPLPCPFCGAAQEAYESDGHLRVAPLCGCFQGMSFRLEDWNRRTPSPAREDLAKAAQAVLDAFHYRGVLPDRELDALCAMEGALLRLDLPSKSEDEVRAEQAVIEAAKELRNEGALQHAWDCGLLDKPNRGKPCDCGVVAMYTALIALEEAQAGGAGKREEGA